MRSSEGGLMGFTMDEQHADESMRVTYEDPGQRDEKRRLMSLLGNDEAVPVDFPPPSKTSNGKGNKGKNLVRRSSRVAGF